MTLSRWRRVATGIAAGVIVLCAALVGASFRDDSGGVSVASDLRPANVIPIEEDPVDGITDDTATTDGDAAEADTTNGDATDPVQVIEVDALPDDTTTDDTATEDTASDDTASAAGTTGDQVEGTTESDESDDSDASDSTAGDTADAESTDTGDTADAAPAPSPPAPAAPAAPADETLGTGGGVDNAECALDRLVVYAGARRGGVAGSIRNALAQAGFGAGCPTPVTVLASNCPLQFAGVLGAGSGYDPTKSYVASSASVDRDTMTAVIGTIGYSGNEIDILNFGFINPDKPGEQWMAIFVPPSFTGWENLASRAGLAPTASSLCAASGELVG